MFSKPNTIKDVVFESAHVEKRVRQYASNRRSGNIIFHGPLGTGKSTLSRIIAAERKKLEDDENAVDVLQASELDEQAISSLYAHWRLGHFGGSSKPYVIIEGVDQLSPKLQRQLRSVLDTTDIGHVIMTTNHIHAVDPPLVDRCDSIEMAAVNGEQWREKARELVSNEGLEISDVALDGIIETSTGSARDLLRGIEDYILKHQAS